MPNPTQDAAQEQPIGPLEIRYVRLSNAVLWDRNPKKHDMGGIIQSILQHGFRDAPIFDLTLGAIVAGNGRTTALQQLQQEGAAAPVGVVVGGDGEWWIPVQMGIDAASVAQAEAFGLDHNLLTATGGDLGFPELVGLFDHDRLVEIMQSAQIAGVQVVSFDPDDLAALLSPPPSGGGEAPPRLDQRKQITCPNCDHVFTPSSAK